jgi:MFS transporter, SP family, solute carrier family 2 (facilitated glucose transporter), member 3
MNAPEKFVFPGHSSGSWALAVASFAIGGPFGAVLGGKLADSVGRRGALLADIYMFMMGGLIQTMAPNLFVVTLSRFLIGIAAGLSTVVVPIFLGELAPPVCLLRDALFNIVHTYYYQPMVA